MSPGARLARIVEQRKLVICVGSGGVGKTSVSAAIGLHAALRGRKVLVVTIDPARRLANALGLEQFGNVEARIDLGALGSAPSPGGELWAMMLDTRHAFDALIARIARDEAHRAEILDNHIYQNISDSFSSSQDYMATEMLYEVMQRGAYDLVVLDTPPVKNALDFLEAPGRLARFLDKRIIKWFLTPYDEGRVFGRLLMGTSAVVFRLLGYIFGRDFLAELSEFFGVFKGLYDGFRERHEAVVDLFRARSTAFVVLSAPTRPSVETAGFFFDELRARSLPTAGAVVNQVHPTQGRPLDAQHELGVLAAAEGDDLPVHTQATVLARLSAAHGRLLELSDLERHLIADLRERAPAGLPIREVPRIDGEVHDLEALRTLSQTLFDMGGEQAAGPG